MANNRKLDIFLGLNNAELKAKLKESQGLLRGFQNNIGGILGGAALGVGIKELGDYALNASKSFEQASISFRVLLGDEERAAKLVNDIQNLANVTPMTSSGLQENAKLLLNFNAVTEDEIIPTLRMLGDITGGNQIKMDSMTLAFAQCASAGRLMGQDLLQMVNAGFNPLQIISEKTGKSIGALKDEMSEGKISVDMVKQAFKDATAEGGRFYGMMEAQSQSKTGLEATKADTYEILARTITDRALPALKDFDELQIEVGENATETVKTFYAWLDVNNQTINAIKNTAIALTTTVVAYTATKRGVELASAAIEYFRYQQVLARTETTALALAMQGKLVLATKALITQFRILTATMLANPWTWVAIAIAGVTASVIHLKNESEKTAAVIEDLSNAQDQNVDSTLDAINAVRELGNAQNLNYEQQTRLDSAIKLLTEKYPKYIDRLREELAVKGEINRETAQEIANEMTLAKLKGLQAEKSRIDKEVENQKRAYRFNNQVAAARFGTPIDTSSGRVGVRKSLQQDQDRVNAEIAKVEKERAAIVNSLTNVGANTRQSRPVTNSGVSVSKSAAEKAQKEALALRLAQLDAEALKVRHNAEEVYKIELKKAQAKINAEKIGTSAYQSALNERTQLMQQHADELIEIELTRYERQQEIQNLQLEKEKQRLESQKESGEISNEDYYNQLQAIEDKKYNIALAGLNKQQELYKNDLAKLEEINQEKLTLQLNYEIQKEQIVSDALKTENERWRDVLQNLGESFQNTLGDFFQGNLTLKESFLNIFGDIKAAFARMIAEMLVEQAKLAAIKSITNLAGAGGWIGTAASFIKGFFADGGIVPGSYNQPVPIVAHGSEMVLNPLQQRNLWNMIASAQPAQSVQTSQASTSASQPVIMNNITPIFQSLDPAQGQKMFNDWMKQSGIPIVKDSIKNNNYQMRDMIKGV